MCQKSGCINLISEKIRETEAELKRCSAACSNLSEYTEKTLEIASALGSEWGKFNFDTCQKIQKLVFPEGVLWDNENRVARTENMNPFFAQIALAVRSIEDLGTTKKDNPNELSRLVDHIIELSNPVIEGFMKVVEFSRKN